ncbi:hypothetical protein K9M78_08220 [Candidatus Bipolaricaulota bacterium]|nr:hypothetical protein [Candidatus Bipolaricaulota bacterium]
MRLPIKILGFLVVSCLLFNLIGSTAVADDNLSPAVPAIASFIVPGAGQLLNEEPNKALTHFVVVLGIDTAAYFLTTTMMSGMPYRLGTTLHLAWAGYSAYDAYQVAKDKKGGIFSSSLQMEEPGGWSNGIEEVSFYQPKETSEFSVSRING